MQKNPTLRGELQDGHKADVGREAGHFLHLDDSFPVGRTTEVRKKSKSEKLGLVKLGGQQSCAALYRPKSF